MKVWIFLITFLVLIPTIAATECQVSEDNSTWVDIRVTTYGGCVDNEYNNISYVQNLDKGTTYYFRCRDDTTNWGYTSTETEQEVDDMQLSIILGIAVVVSVLLYIAFKIDEEHFFLKLLFVFFAVSILLLIPKALLDGEIVASGTLLNSVLWLQRIFFGYVFVYLSYWGLNKVRDSIFKR